MIKTKGQLEWKDYLNATLLHMQPTGVTRYLFYVIISIIGLFVIGMIWMAATNRLPIGLMLPGFILYGFAAIYRYVLLPIRIKKIFSHQKELVLPFELEITDPGLVFTNELGKTTRPWNHFLKWKESKDILMLYHSDVLFSIVPKRLCSDSSTIESIRAYLKNNNIPAVKNRRFFIGCILFFVFMLITVIMVYVNIRQAV